MALGVVEVEHGHLAYEREGEGPPVVFLHGLGLDHGVWTEVAERMVDRFDTIRVDLRGHGASTDPVAPFSHYEDLARLLDALELSSVHLAGLSMGGAAAVDFALAFPERVRALALVDSALHGHGWSPEWVRAFRAARRAGRERGEEAGRDAWAAHPMFEGEPSLRRDSGRRWVGPHFACALEPPAALRLEDVKAPTLVIVGERDLADFRAIASTLAADIPHARLEILEGVGHLSPLEAPDRVAALLAEHFREP